VTRASLLGAAGRVGAAAAAIGLLALVVAGVIVLQDPRIPLLMIGAALAATIGLALLQHPLATLFIALFLLLLPPGELRIEAVYQLVSNGALAAALGAWMLHAIAQSRGARWNVTLLLVMLYIAWCIVTLLWAPDLIEGRRKLITWTFSFIILFLISNPLRTLRDVDGIMSVLRLMGWILVIASLYTVVFSGYAFGQRLRVFDINENTMGLMLLATLPGVMWPVLRATGARRTARMALSVVFILCALAIIALSGSRGGALSIVLLLVTFLFTKSARIWGLLGLLLILGMMVAAPFLLDLLMQRFQEGEGGEFGGRQKLWEASLLLIRDYAWTGVGIGNGPFQLSRYYASVTSGSTRLDLPSHQPFLEVTIETGLFGLLIYGGIMASAFWSFWRFRSAWQACEEAPSGYYAIVSGIWVAYIMAWIKSGGVENHPSFIALLSLLLVPSLLLRVPASDSLRQERSTRATARYERAVR
jgi:O-antigen ligase